MLLLLPSRKYETNKKRKLLINETIYWKILKLNAFFRRYKSSPFWNLFLLYLGFLQFWTNLSINFSLFFFRNSVPINQNDYWADLNEWKSFTKTVNTCSATLGHILQDVGLSSFSPIVWVDFLMFRMEQRLCSLSLHDESRKVGFLIWPGK